MQRIKYGSLEMRNLFLKSKRSVGVCRGWNNYRILVPLCFVVATFRACEGELGPLN